MPRLNWSLSQPIDQVPSADERLPKTNDVTVEQSGSVLVIVSLSV